MMHALAYGGAVVASTSNQNVSAVTDNVVTLSSNNKYICPAKVQIVAAHALNDFATRSRVNFPSYRTLTLPEIFPITRASVPAATPLVTYWDGYGPTVQQNEELGVDLSCGASVTLNASAFLLIRDKPTSVPAGPKMRIVGTATLTLVANAWVSGTMTLDQTLPFGDYAVIGAAFVCTNAFIGRLIFPRNMAWRPGWVTTGTIGGVDAMQYSLAGNLGQWGVFNSVAQPLIEVFGITAGAQTITVILDLVQLTAPTTM